MLLQFSIPLGLFKMITFLRAFTKLAGSITENTTRNASVCGYARILNFS